MSGEIVNLRRARKEKARAERRQQAGARRQEHGRSKAERRHDAAMKLIDKKRLDGAIRKPTNQGPAD